MQYKNHDMHKRIFNPAFKVHTLTTCGGGNTQKKVYIDGRARKLTPFEYERLQTLPSGYTMRGNYDGKIKLVADGHRYSCCGNGWTVDVIAYILSFIPSAT
jgi:DNA (cytosine-5)-methyltransferase 3A